MSDLKDKAIYKKKLCENHLKGATRSLPAVSFFWVFVLILNRLRGLIELFLQDGLNSEYAAFLG